MKKTLILLTVLIWTAISFAQVKQEGITVLQNSGKKPVGGVQITAAGSAPAGSDNAGKFSLHFPKSHAGEMLFINEIYKNGYATVNEEELKRWILSGENVLPVVLCKKEILAATQQKYYEIGKTNYRDRYNRAIEELEKTNRNRALSEEEYDKHLEAIAKEYSQAMTQLESYSYIIAGLNKDYLTQIEKEAIEYIDKGEVSKGIEVIESAKLLDKFKQLARLEHQTQEDMDKMVPSLRHYADLCMFDAGEKNLQKAKDIYYNIAISDTTNYVYARDYAEFLVNYLYDFTNSKEWLERALRHAGNDYQQAEALMGLAVADTYLLDYTKAELRYKKAYELLNKIQVEEKDIDLNEAFTSLEIGYARLQNTLHNYEQALQAGLSAIKHARTLYKKNPEKYAYHYAFAYHETASILNESRSDITKAISYYDKARNIFQKASAKDKIKAQQMIAGGYINIAAAYSHMGKFDKVKQYGDSTLALTNKYMNANPSLFAPLKASALINIGLGYCAIKQEAKGIELFKQSLAIRDSLYSTPDYFAIAQTLYHLCNYVSLFKDKREVEQYTVRAIDLYNKLHYNSTYYERLATCYAVLIAIRYELKKHVQMEESVLALLQYMDLTDPGSTKFNLDYMEIIYNFMSYLYKVTECSNSPNKATVFNLYKNILKRYPSSPEKKQLNKQFKQLCE